MNDEIQQQSAAPRWDARPKSVALAVWLSLMPGLGQIYVGYYQRGFINAVIVAAIITALASGSVRGLEPMLGMFLAFFWLYNMIDAGRRAALYNQALEGAQGVELPQDFKMPEGGGSLLGGVILIVLGILVFLSTKFNVSMAWLEEWWPLAAVALGVHLVWKARRRRA